MKVAGKTPSKRAPKIVVLDRTGGEKISLTITALPLGFVEMTLQDRLPLPMPVKKYAVDARNAVLKDKDGIPVLEQVFESQEFRSRVRKAKSLQGIAMIYEAVKNDLSIQWETPKGENWEVFYESIMQEMSAWLTTGELAFILGEITGLSMLKQQDVDDARDSFLSKGASAPAGGSPSGQPQGTNGTSSSAPASA